MTLFLDAEYNDNSIWFYFILFLFWYEYKANKAMALAWPSVCQNSKSDHANNVESTKIIWLGEGQNLTLYSLSTPTPS